MIVLWNGDGAGICSPSFLYLEATIGAYLSSTIKITLIFGATMVKRFVLTIFLFFWSHRIVLERPEYGYATYFFEIVQSLPIEWQIRRLVIAMKIAGCGRTALIENRSLLVRLWFFSCFNGFRCM